MNRRLMLLMLVALSALSVWAGATSTLLKTRRSASSSVVPGYWHASFSKAKSYAVAKKVPLIAVWSNGDACGHCVMFENAVNSSKFRTWMKESGCVFFFTYSGESAGAVGGTVFHWVRKNTNTSYPFVRIYWPAGGVDVGTIGDIVDGRRDNSAGGANAITYLKGKLARFFAKAKPIVKPYTIEFDPNGATNTMASVRAKVGTALTLPACTLRRPDYSFSGWAKTATGAVAYKNKASVKNLTTVSNGVVTLYARWLKTTYRTYYVGIAYTITLSSSLKGWTTSTKIPGMKWDASRYRWTGRPTKAGTYTVKFKKGGSSATRKIVIVQDALVWAEGAQGRILPLDEEIDLDLSPTSAVGAPTSVTVTGLPDGLTYQNGHITGHSKIAGTFRLTVTAVSSVGQKLTRTYLLNIGVPDCCIGTFNGFVGHVESGQGDPLALADRGTFRLAAPSNAALSARIVTAKATYALTATGWTVNADGTSYTARLATAGGGDVLTLTVDARVPSTASIAGIGTFVPSYGTAYEVRAQRAPFDRDATGGYKDALVREVMPKVVGTWYFQACPVLSRWVLVYATAKTKTLTLQVKADGTATLAGKVGSYSVSASSAVFIFEEDVEAGYVRADFPIPVTVGKTKKTLDVWLNLWFDRSTTHGAGRDEGIGGASLEDFR